MKIKALALAFVVMMGLVPQSAYAAESRVSLSATCSNATVRFDTGNKNGVYLGDALWNTQTTADVRVNNNNWWDASAGSMTKRASNGVMEFNISLDRSKMKGTVTLFATVDFGYIGIGVPGDELRSNEVTIRC